MNFLFRVCNTSQIQPIISPPTYAGPIIIKIIIPKLHYLRFLLDKKMPALHSSLTMSSPLKIHCMQRGCFCHLLSRILSVTRAERCLIAVLRCEYSCFHACALQKIRKESEERPSISIKVGKTMRYSEDLLSWNFS